MAAQVREYDKQLRANLPASQRDLPFLDLRKFELEGVSAPESHLLRIEVKGKYPSVPELAGDDIFAPIPGRREAFYAQRGMAKTTSL